MDSRRKIRPSAKGQPQVVTAPTLKEAYRRIKLEYGDDAVIIGSRTINQRQSLGLGNEKLVEVRVQASGESGPYQPEVRQPWNTEMSGTPGVTSDDIVREVERIEDLVATITANVSEQQNQAQILRDNPLADTLIERGTGRDTVEKIFTRYSSETGMQPDDRVGALKWMTDNLGASNCDWEGFYGCHAFLGQPGSGRTQMVHTAAGKLQKLGRKTLVLAVMPESSGDVRSLQTAASEMGFDAAVIQDNSQLASSEAHLASYEAVLLDLPDFNHPAMALGSPLHGWLADNASFHRHLVLPMDGDPGDMVDLATVARQWQIDWIAISRLDLTHRQGKILDFAEIFPTPISIFGQNSGQDPQLEIAQSGGIMDLILGTAEGKTVEQIQATTA